MNLLIVDNNINPDSWGAPDLVKYARLATGATIHVRRAPAEDLPENPRAFDRIILSGSKTSALADAPWITRLLEFVRRSLDEGKPLLGVCYGHQMLARLLAGEDSVGKSQMAEIGWTKIEVTHPSPLFTGLPTQFYSFSSHYEEVKKLPPGCRALARSEACGIQAMQVGDKPVFGIQFHPERDAAQADERFRKAKSERTRPEFVLGEGKSGKLFDPKVGETIFRNFLSLR
ncbi:MAG TPA: type 1 glutamine amidotransferase [Bdellovibrionota bacterium]|nr:type 1 glutamine amidotransferase [Bdellovibrionota bacterium]